jgi:hypothetical protein
VRELLLSSLGNHAKLKNGAEKQKDENEIKANKKRAYILERKNKEIDISPVVEEENLKDSGGEEYDSDGEILKDGKVVITGDNLAVHQNRGKSDNLEDGADEEEEGEGLEVWGMDAVPMNPALNGKVREENVLSDRFDDEGEDDDDEIDGEGGGHEISAAQFHNVDNGEDDLDGEGEDEDDGMWDGWGEEIADASRVVEKVQEPIIKALSASAAPFYPKGFHAPIQEEVATFSPKGFLKQKEEFQAEKGKSSAIGVPTSSYTLPTPVLRYVLVIYCWDVLLYQYFFIICMLTLLCLWLVWIGLDFVTPSL